MSERNEKTGSGRDTKPAPVRTDVRTGPSYREDTETEGWALQWDTTALRKMSLARKMRHLRQSSAD